MVIQAGAMGKGGDVFVRYGQDFPCVCIVDLTANLIKISGLEVKSQEYPLGDIKTKFTALRPGGKLFEELLIGDDVKGCEHERIMRVNERFLPYSEYKLILDKLDAACHSFDHEAIRGILLSVPAGFTQQMALVIWFGRLSNR
nr:polysaccharide biosynthesis protein [Shewanella violacea]